MGLVLIVFAAIVGSVVSLVFTFLITMYAKGQDKDISFSKVFTISWIVSSISVFIYSFEMFLSKGP